MGWQARYRMSRLAHTDENRRFRRFFAGSCAARAADANAAGQDFDETLTDSSVILCVDRSYHGALDTDGTEPSLLVLRGLRARRRGARGAIAREERYRTTSKTVTVAKRRRRRSRRRRAASASWRKDWTPRGRHNNRPS